MASLAPTAAMRSFFPRSRVLLERRLVTFDSDDDDGHGATPLPTQTPVRAIVGDAIDVTGSKIAYTHEGRVECERFDVCRADLVVALQSLPRDTWTTLLDESDRQRLTAYLPPLEGWHGMTSEEAQRVAVEALLSWENLHFGNPLTALAQSVRDGHCSVEATRARKIDKKLSLARFELERESIIRARTEALQTNKDKERQALGDPLPPWKKIRLSSVLPFIHRNASTDATAHRTVLVSNDTSLFLALRSILTDTDDSHRLNEIVEKLRRDFPRQSASVENDVPLFLAFDKYIKAALTFLSGKHVSLADAPHWSTAVFVAFNADSDQYKWSAEDHDTQSQSLLLLEQVFRAPVPSDFLDYASNSSRVKATRKRRQRILTQRARDALLASDPAFAVLDAYRSSRPSWQLKRALLDRAASPSHISDRG